MLNSLVFINRDKVVMKLIKQRCKYADSQAELDQRKLFIHRSCLRRSLNENKLSKSKQERKEIYSLFPPRSKWLSISRDERMDADSVKRNELRLKKTYLYAKRTKSKDEWYVRLCQKADFIVQYAMTNRLPILPPQVCVIQKKVEADKKKIACRPVCKFPTIDKIVFSLLNSYLTNLFDDYFYNCSFAFRKPSEQRSELQHLDAVVYIRNFRKRHVGESLYVAECDMQKFYDTLRHSVIKRRFMTLLRKAKRDGKIDDWNFKMVRHWFFAYIDCFDFKSQVWIHNKKPISHPFWKNIKNGKGYDLEIGWINPKHFDYKKADCRNGRVGVPQGGPLSGLIANVVMHYVDAKVLESNGSNDMIYCRFCDDMILVGTKKDAVTQSFDTYQQAIKDVKLVAHENRTMEKAAAREFWEGKTRGPYEWNEKGDNVYPWITFVGFDINWRGNLRIRKASFKRQLDKQSKIASELLLPYKCGKKARYSKGTIWNSLQSRLIATSVGRVSLWNYLDNHNQYSWMNAFSILDKNKWSEKQMRDLDWHRQLILARAKKKLLNITCPETRKDKMSDIDARELYAFKGSPFSYYGQCFVYKSNLN